MYSAIDNASKVLGDWPSEGLERVSKCPVCGGVRRTLLYEGLTDKVFCCAPGKWSMYECSTCKSGYLDPRPTSETIGEAYETYFTHAAGDGAGLRGVRRLRRALANGYRNKRYGTKEQPSNTLGYWILKLLPSHRSFVDAMMRHLPPPPDGGRLLDIGCGSGEFLARARDSGWAVVGVDPDPKARMVARARGLDVRNGGVEQLSGMSQCFDGITLSHVIEHVHDPASLLNSCFELLKPGGWIWIDTPNLTSAGCLKYALFWVHLDAPRHLCLFTPDSLKLLTMSVGFEEIRDEPWRPLYLASSLASENIKMNAPPFNHRRKTMRDRVQGWWAESRWKRSAQKREFITIRARKPGA